MPKIIRSETYNPKDLSAAELTALIDQLYSVHQEIFAGVDRAEFARYVVQSPADKTRIRVSYGEGGELAGYVAVHAFRRTFRGEQCTVTRAEAGLRRRYRGDGAMATFVLSQLLKTQWDYEGAHYYLGCLVHPSSYAFIARGVDPLWPAPGVEIPADLHAFMLELADSFHLEVIDPARPLVRRVGWITRDTEVERRYWQSTDHKAPRYFIEQNPGYGSGHGLLTLFQIDPAAAGKLVLNWARIALRKRLQRLTGTLERKVLRPRLAADAAENLLRGFEQASGRNLDGIRRLGIVGSRYPVAARTVLFRAGDPADAMYVILSGSLFVLAEGPGGEERVIDQLGPGAVVGEMALMTGKPRNATVRAAAESVLLRLTLREVKQLLAAEPLLAELLWKQIGARSLPGAAAGTSG
jgi:CRP-like cAMP-binding protein